MNNFTSALKGKYFGKKTIAIPISNLSQQTTQKRLSQTKVQAQTSYSRYKISSLKQQISECPTIITARKRQDYCGYKQMGLDRSKFGRFLSTKRERPFRYPERKQETNLSNITMLKKRFSLDSDYFQFQKQRGAVKSRNRQFKLKQQSCIKNQEQNKLRQLMKNILSKEKQQKRFTILYSKQSSGFTSQRLTEHQKHSDFQRYKSQIDQNTSYVQKDQTFQHQLQLSFQKLGGRKKHQNLHKRERDFFKTQQSKHQNYKNDENQRQICGWQSKTFYGKNNNIALRKNLLIRKSKRTQ